MAIEIFWGSGSPFAWRTLLALEWKKIPYTSNLITFSKGEHKAPGFLEMNPRGKVPVMKDGDVTLYETLAIINYLEQKFPEPALLGRTLAERGRIWREISECIYYLEPALFGVVVPILFGGLEEKAAEVKKQAEAAHVEIDRINKFLSSNDWVTGSQPNGADVWLYPVIALLARSGARDNAKPLNLGFDDLGGRYPAIRRWKGRMEQQPGYERAFPPHWKQAA